MMSELKKRKQEKWENGKELKKSERKDKNG